MTPKSEIVVKVVVMLALLSGLCVGCLIIPSEEAGAKATAQWQGQAANLQTAHATREEVSRELATPPWDFQDLQVICYQWSGAEWSVFWVAGGIGGADWGEVKPTKHRLLLMSFDAKEHLNHSQVVEQSQFKTVWQQALHWRQKLDPPLPAMPPTRFAPSPPPADRSVVHLYWDKNLTVVPVRSVTIDGNVRAQIRKGFFTTLVLEPGCHKLAVDLAGSLDVDMANGQILYVRVHPPWSQNLGEGHPTQALFKSSEEEALPKLRRLQFCR
jgi:hypothetical protein